MPLYMDEVSMDTNPPAPKPESQGGATRWRKKPVVIEAILWTGQNIAEVGAFAPDKEWTLAQRVDGDVTAPITSLTTPGYPRLLIRTLEGNMWANRGDWIIKGVKGEFYPCKPDIFAATYEPAPQEAPVEPEVGAGDAREGRARAAAVEALHRIETGQYCGEPSCPATLQRLAVAGLSGVQPLPECPSHVSAAPPQPDPAPPCEPHGKIRCGTCFLDSLAAPKVDPAKEPWKCAERLPLSGERLCSKVNARDCYQARMLRFGSCGCECHDAPAPSLSEPGSPPRTNSVTPFGWAVAAEIRLSRIEAAAREVINEYWQGSVLGMIFDGLQEALGEARDSFAASENLRRDAEGRELRAVLKFNEAIRDYDKRLGEAVATIERLEKERDEARQDDVDARHAVALLERDNAALNADLNHWKSRVIESDLAANAAEQQVAALREALEKIEAASWDSGSTPTPEVVSRIYCIATKALTPARAPIEPASPEKPHRFMLPRWDTGPTISCGRCGKPRSAHGAAEEPRLIRDHVYVEGIAPGCNHEGPKCGEPAEKHEVFPVNIER